MKKVWARDEAHAIKIFSEKRRELSNRDPVFS